MQKPQPSNFSNLAFVALFVAMVTVAAFKAIPKSGTNLLQGVLSPLPTFTLGNSPDATNDEPGDVAKFFAIEWTTNGVDLVLHRLEAVAQGALEVTLVGSTNLVTATWEPFMNVTFPAGDTNVSATVGSAMLDAHSVSNMCFFAFINTGDSDGDGLADWDERFNLKTDPYSTDSDGDDLDDALDPAPAEFDPFSRAHWTVWDDATQFADGSAPGVVFETTVWINRRSRWRQYFLSGSPDGAAAWSLGGATLEWEDSGGASGTISAPPAGDSLRLALSADAEWVAFRLRVPADATFTAPPPLHLLTYRPRIEIDGETVEEETAPNRVLAVFTGGAESPIPITVDRSARPCAAALSAEELGVAELLERDFETEAVDYFPAGTSGDGDDAGDGGGDNAVEEGCFLPPHPGFFPWPGCETFDEADWKRGILVLDPSVVFAADSCSNAGRVELDAETGTHSAAVDWPLDTACLRRAWRSDADGGWDERPEPMVDPGVDTNKYPFVACSLAISPGGGSCTGTVRVFGAEVWSGDADRIRRPCRGEDPADPFDDGCGCCSSGCADGDCDALERPAVLNSSLCFRIPGGSPRKGQVSSFLSFAATDPSSVSLSPALFELSARPDASVEDATEGTVRTVACSDDRGRDVALESIPDGVRATVRDHATQRLEHTWEITRPNGSGSRIRFHRISRLDNTMDDLTFAYDWETGSWTREDAVSGAQETVAVAGDLDDAAGGSIVETRTTTAADGTPLVRTVVERRRLGSRRGAVLRDTRKAEYGWDAEAEEWVLSTERFADYCDDPNQASFGKVRLVHGIGTQWVHRSYDAEGREILRVEQRDGSALPSWFPAPSEYGDGFSTNSSTPASFVTVFGYAPHDGDAGVDADSDLPRTESRFAVAGESSMLVSRVWRVYTHPTVDGRAAVKCETWRAAHAGDAIGDGRCARSYTVAYDEHAPGVPLVLRGETAEALDEDGIRIVRTSSVVGDAVTTTERKYKGENEFPTYTVEERDATRGNLLRRAEYVRAAAVEGGMETDDVLVDEETNLYDEKDRLRSTTYLDGTSETHHYSCCRLLWREDREGRRTLRSATTGRDHLYYAEEDVYLGEISFGGHRATQHFFDALGRETNTTVFVAVSEGEAVDETASRGREESVRTVAYPRGTDDLVVRVDERGAVRTTETFRCDDRVVTREVVSTNGVGVVTNTTTAYLGGATVARTSWAGGWRETRDADEYDMRLGNHSRRRTVSASDLSSYTAERSRIDMLGRVWSTDRPGAGGGTVNHSITFDGASSRVVQTSVTGRSCTNYFHDDLGELVQTARDGVSVHESRTYERDPDDGELYRVERASRRVVAASGETVPVRETRTRLTGLSAEPDGVLSRRVQIGEDGRETVEERTVCDYMRDPAYVWTTRWTGDETPVRTYSHKGVTSGEYSSDGDKSYYYDALGRTSGIQHADWMCGDTWLDYSYDESGNVVEVFDSMSQLSSVGHARTRIAYDRLGRETTREDTFGHVVTNAYDALGQPALATGDRHPVSTGYDASGNRTRLATTRDGGATWDATQWEFAVPGGRATWDATQWEFAVPGGRATAKVYADSSRVAYTRTQEGWPVRTTWARGAWKEYAYDGHGNVTGMSYSSTPSVSLSYDALDCLVSAENSASGADHFAYACTYDAHRNCTEEAVTVGGRSFTLSRTFDEFLRPSSVSVSRGGTIYAAKTRTYDSENRVGGYTLGGDGTSGSGLAVSVSYQGHLPVGMTYTFPNGNTMTLALSREPGRSTWITLRDYEFNGTPLYWHRTAYDAEGRPTETEDSLTATRQWLYNRRSELVGASGTQAHPYDYAYSYDSIGNRLTSSDDSGTATYVANNLNQYTAVNRTIDQSVQSNNFTYDADGNLTQDDRFNYAYDDENRLVSVTPTNPIYGSRAIENAYDHRNRRIKKIVKSFDGSGMGWRVESTHVFVWNGWNIVLEQITFADSTTRTIEYYWGNDLSGTEQGAGGVGGLLATRIDGVFYVPVYGSNGNIMIYVGEHGSIVAQYDYDPYGNILQSSDPFAQQFAFGFSTKYHDHEVALVAYQLRTYNPTHGRWLNRDPIEEAGGENLYVFCNNSALQALDYLGNVPTGTVFLDAYAPYDYSHGAAEIWHAVGGTLKELLWNDETKDPPNTCATRISIALIKSNEQIANGGRQYINTVKRGCKGIHGNYIVRASTMQDYLTSVWGTSSILSASKAYYFKSKAKKNDIAGLRKEIEKKLKCSNVPRDKYVCIVSSKVTGEPGVSGHIGVVTKTYADRYMPYSDNSVVWILPPTKRMTSK